MNHSKRSYGSKDTDERRITSRCSPEKRKQTAREKKTARAASARGWAVDGPNGPLRCTPGWAACVLPRIRPLRGKAENAECASTYLTWLLGQPGPACRRHPLATLVPRWPSPSSLRKNAGRGPTPLRWARPPAVAVAPVSAAGHRGPGKKRPAAPHPKTEATATGKPGGDASMHDRRARRRRSRMVPWLRCIKL